MNPEPYPAPEPVPASEPVPSSEPWPAPAPREPGRPSEPATIADLRARLAELTPVDEREAASLLRIAAELERLPHPLDEHADKVHFTASAIVVGSRGVILHRHKRLGLWLQPGGHIDPGESPAEAVVREVREETGLPVRHAADGPHLIHVDVHDGGRGHIHLDLRYLLQAEGGDPQPEAGESQEVRWFGWEEAIAVADPGLEGALHALRPPQVKGV